MAKVQEHVVDRRTIKRNIQKGMITKADYEAHLKALPDLTDRAVFIGAQDLVDDDDMDDVESEEA